MTAFTLRFFIDDASGQIDEVTLHRHECNNHSAEEGVYVMKCTCAEFEDEDFCVHIDRSLLGFDASTHRFGIPVSSEYTGEDSGGYLGDEADAEKMREFVLKHGYIEVV